MLELATAFRRATSWKQRWNVIFGKPDDIDPAIRGQLETVWLRKTGSRKQTKGQRIYIIIQTAVSISLLFATSLLEAYIPPGLAVFIVLFILVSLVNTGAIPEQKKWFFLPGICPHDAAGGYLYGVLPAPVRVCKRADLRRVIDVLFLEDRKIFQTLAFPARIV